MNSTTAPAIRSGTFSKPRAAGPATFSRYGSGNARRQTEPGAQLVAGHEIAPGVRRVGLGDLLLSNRIAGERDGLLHGRELVLRQEHEVGAPRPGQPQR